jgi:POT family proton-dependent oligopeptide transporter
MMLAKKKMEPSTAMKMVIGLMLLGTGFVFMVIGAKGADHGIRVSWIWLTTAYLFHTLGELCLSPIGLSYVTKVAPVRFASLMMGVWFLANAAANKLAGTIAAMVEKIPTLTQFYTIFVVSSFSAAFLMLLCVPLLKRLTSSVKA